MKRTKSIDNPEPQQPDSGSSSTRTFETEEHDMVTDSEELSLRLSSRRKLRSASKIQDQDILPESLDSESDSMAISKPPSSVPKLLLDTTKSTDSQERERSKSNTRSLTGRRSLVSHSQSADYSDSPFESKAKTYRRPSPRRPSVSSDLHEDKMKLVTPNHQRTASTPIPVNLRPPSGLPPPLPNSPVSSILSTPEEVESIPFGSLSPQSLTSPPCYPPPPLSPLPILPPPESLPPPLPNTISPLSEIQNHRIINQSDTETDITSPKTSSRENGHRRKTKSEREQENFISPRDNSKSLKKQDSVTMRGLIPNTKERLRKRYLSRSKSGHSRKNSETQKSPQAKCCCQCAVLLSTDTPLESSDKQTEEILYCQSCAKLNPTTENNIPLEL